MRPIAAAIFCSFVLLPIFVQFEAIVAADRQATIVVDAVSFLHDLPQHDTWIDAGGGRGRGGISPSGVPSTPANLPSSDSLFNRCGIVLQSEANLYCVKEIPEPGTYYLFVR